MENVASPETLCGEYVGLLPRGLLCDQRNVRASTGVVLDAIDQVSSRPPALKIYGPYSSFSASATMPDGDAPIYVSTAFALALFGIRQGQERSAFP